MLETLGVALFVLVAGFLLFLPSLAARWWQSRERDENESE